MDGIPEVITHGVTGFLHGHQDSGALADLILRCLADPQAARKVGLAAREHCRRTYSSEVFARNAIAMYKEFFPLVD